MTRCLLPFLLVAVGAYAADAPRLLPFQARMNDATGKPIPDGATVIQFQLFDQPTGGTPVWAGELHRTTVNGGLVNVVLGTKNPLPVSHPADTSRPLFGSTLYLQATPDANGDGKITDDVPLLPRQAIIPVLFAAQSAVSQTSLDSAKLAGRDWSSILEGGATDPVTGKLDGRRLADGSIDGAALKPLSVSGNAFADGAVTARHLKAGAVQIQHLETRLPATVNAAVGRLALSERIPGDEWQTNAESPTPVPALQASLNTSGRPVRVYLVPTLPATTDPKSVTYSSNRDMAYVGVFGGADVAGAQAEVELIRNGTDSVGIVRFAQQSGGGGSQQLVVSPSHFEFLDIPPTASLHTYSIRARSGDRRMSLVFRNVRLVAYEW